MRINKLNIDIAEVTIEGLINGLTYSDVESVSKKGGNILGKIFK